MGRFIKLRNESQMMFVKGWAEHFSLLIKNNPWFVSVKPNMESPNLTVTAEQTHLCVFTFPAPKPVLAPSFHGKSSVFYFEKEKKRKYQPKISSQYIYSTNDSAHPHCAVQPERKTYPRRCVWDGTSGNERPASPCCVHVGGRNAIDAAREGEVYKLKSRKSPKN